MLRLSLHIIHTLTFHVKMPHLKEPKKKEPLWKDWNYKADKKGVRHTVYSVNGDAYTGEWNANKKDGKQQIYDTTYMYL